MTILLTGATGFIGLKVLEMHLAYNQAVRVLIRPQSQPRSAQVQQLLRQPNVEVISADLSDRQKLARAVKGVDKVYHLAWSGTPQEFEKDDQSPTVEDAETNLTGAENLLQAAVSAGVRRFLFTSSVAVYGPPAAIFKLPVSENSTLMQRDYEENSFTQNYMAPKIAVEHALRMYAVEGGFDYVILRPSIVYGPGAAFATGLVKRCLYSPQPDPSANQQGEVQMVHVKDLAMAIFLAGLQPQAANKEFIISGHDMASMAEIQEFIQDTVQAINSGQPRGAISLNRDAGFHDYRFPRYDISRARQVLQFNPQVSLQTGLEEMVASAVSQGDLKHNFGERHWSGEKGKVPMRASFRNQTGNSPKNRRSGWAVDRKNGHQQSGQSVQTSVVDFYNRFINDDFFDKYFQYSDFWNFGLRFTGQETPLEASLNLMDEIFLLIQNPTGKILDVACGKGATTRYLSRHYPPKDVYAINISAEQLGVARKNAPGCNFLQMDACHLQFPDNSFENIISVEAAFHFETRLDFFKEACRVLKPGGRLILTDAIHALSCQVQPQANYVANIQEYCQEMQKAGFAGTSAIDLTQECWGAFTKDILAYTTAQVRSGQATPNHLTAILNWVHDRGAHLYVLAAAIKHR